MLSETIQEAKNGDARAFALIVRQYRQSVFRICVRILGDSDEAEDAVQETFVRAWQAISSPAVSATTCCAGARGGGGTSRRLSGNAVETALWIRKVMWPEGTWKCGSGK